MAVQNQQYQPKQKLNEKEASILEYIKKNENEPKKLTINQVASAMNKKGICSRLTTSKIIFNLMNLKLIKDEKIGNKFHKLKINDEYYYDSNKLEEELLKYQIQKALEPFKTLLKNKKMEVHVINKAKGETYVIVGIEATLQNEKYYLPDLEETIVRLAKTEAEVKAEIEKYKNELTPNQMKHLQSNIQQLKSSIQQMERMQSDLKQFEKMKTNDIYTRRRRPVVSDREKLV